MVNNNLAYKDDEYSYDDNQGSLGTVQKERIELKAISERAFQQYFERDVQTNEKDISQSYRIPERRHSVTDEYIENIGEEKKPVFKSFQSSNLSTFKVLQKWEGIVEEIDEDYFSARVTDRTDETEDEYVEFDLEEIDPEDKDLLQKGAIFYWSIGYYTSQIGQRFRASEIRFRRLPAWSRKDLEEARNKASFLAQQLKVINNEYL